MTTIDTLAPPAPCEPADSPLPAERASAELTMTPPAAPPAAPAPADSPTPATVPVEGQGWHPNSFAGYEINTTNVGHPGGEAEVLIRVCLGGGRAGSLVAAGERRFDVFRALVHELAERSDEYTAWRSAADRLTELESRQTALREEADAAAVGEDAMLRGGASASELEDFLRASRNSKTSLGQFDGVVGKLRAIVHQLAFKLLCKARAIARDEMLAEWVKVEAEEKSLSGLIELARAALDALLTLGVYHRLVFHPYLCEQAADKAAMTLLGGPLPDPPAPEMPPPPAAEGFQHFAGLTLPSHYTTFGAPAQKQR